MSGLRFPNDPLAITLPLFGDATDPLNIDIRALDLSIARNNVEIKTNGGTFLWVVQASDTSALANVKFSHSWADAIPMRKGMVVRGIKFSSIFVTNTAQVGKSVTLAIANSQSIVIDNPVEAITSTKSVPRDVFSAPIATVAVNAANTLLSNVDNLREEIVLTNSGAGTVYINGNVGAIASEGVPLVSGAAIVLSTSAAIYARNDTGLAVNISVATIGYSL